MGRAGTPVSRIAPVELLLVGVLVAVATTLYMVYALRVAQFQNDEEQYLSLARYVAAHFPDALFQSGIYPRGPQRLDAWIMAIPFAIGRGPDAYEIAHGLQCLMFASTAMPVFLLARRTGLTVLWGLLAATLSIVVPWAIVATSFLAESAAYPAYAWVLYATWMAVAHPSLRREALVLLAVVIAVLSRTAMLALVPLLPLAVLWHEWSWGLTDLSLGERARRLPGRIAARHPLSALMIVLGAFTLIADRLKLLPGRGLAAAAGGYGLPQLESLTATVDRFRQYLARAAVGTGFLALVVALPWTVSELLRARDRQRHQTAIICTLGVGAILLSLLAAGPDERYIAYLAVPISIAAAAALSDAAAARPARRAQAGMLAGAAVVIALITSASWPGLTNAYDFFVYPSAMFYQRALLTRGGKVHIPLIHPSAEVRIVAAVLVATLAFIMAFRVRRLARVAPAVLGLTLVGVCLTQTLYAMKKFTEQVGAAGPSADQRSWVDLHVPSGARVGALALSMGAGPFYVPIWRDIEFWNLSTTQDVYFENPGFLPLPLGSEAVQLTIQPESGLMHANLLSGRATAVPRYLLVPSQGTNSSGLHGTPIAQSSYLPVTLMRLAPPARIDWTTAGTSEEGFIASGTPAEATVYNRAAREVPHPCATFSLLPPPGFTGSWPFTVTRKRHVVSRGRLIGQRQVNLAIGLGPLTGPTTTLVTRVHSHVGGAGGATLGARLAFFTIATCRAHHS
jgi:hypothetical protein